MTTLTTQAAAAEMAADLLNRMTSALKRGDQATASYSSRNAVRLCDRYDLVASRTGDAWTVEAA